MCREMHPLLPIIYLLLFSEIRNSDECAIFKVALKNSCSKNNEPEKKLHK